MKKLSPQFAETRARWLAHTASACLVDEARLSPKPGLVDSRGNGAHQDLSLALMERSARGRRTLPCVKPLAGWAAKAKRR